MERVRILGVADVDVGGDRTYACGVDGADLEEKACGVGYGE